MAHTKSMRLTRNRVLLIGMNRRSRGHLGLGWLKMCMAVFSMSVVLLHVTTYLAMNWPTPIRRTNKISRLTYTKTSIRNVLSLPVINPFNYEQATVSRVNCKEGAIIMVASAPSHFVYRDAIRQTWGREVNKDNREPPDPTLDEHAAKTQRKRSGGSNSTRVSDYYAVLFFVGAVVGHEEESDFLRHKLLGESELNGDMVISSFVDTYGNLSLKSMAMFRWAVQFCPATGMYFVKCDDDTFLNVPVLLKALQEADTSGKHFVIGHLLEGLTPYRGNDSKYYVSAEEYRNEKYPIGLSGAAYAMKIETAKLIYEVALRTKLFRLEDVYIIGFCAGRIGVDLVADPRFSLKRHLNECEQAAFASGHEYSPTQMVQVYKYLRNHNC